MATKTTTPGLESIDRLEEKIKLLVNTIGRIKGEQNRVAEETSASSTKSTVSRRGSTRRRAPAPK
jgi:archaellum component FlaC